MNFKELQEKLVSLYDSVPSLNCGSCWGECCVTPTMTAVEFIHMMRDAKSIFTQEELFFFICQPMVEHNIYQGNSHCRFQNMESGRCQVYKGRAMACRLHGHEALRLYETDDLVFCDKQPDIHRNLKDKGFEEILSGIRDTCMATGFVYDAPYYLLSMNLECWLDFYFIPGISQGRPQLESNLRFIQTHLELEKPEGYYSHTTLEGKINTIDRFFTVLSIQDADPNTAFKLVKSLLNDFPTAGSYFLQEASQFEKLLREKYPDYREPE